MSTIKYRVVHSFSRNSSTLGIGSLFLICEIQNLRPLLDWLFVQEIYPALFLACYKKPYYNMLLNNCRVCML